MSQLDRRRVLKLMGAMAAAGAAGACATSESGSTTTRPSGKQIKIGLLAPRSGQFQAVGADLTDGFNAFLEANSHRLGPHDVQLLAIDEGNSPDAARRAAESLINNGVIAITGGANSATVTAIRELVEKAKIPFVGANGSPIDLTSVHYMWRASYVDGEAGRALAKHMTATYNKVYAIGDETPASRAEVESFSRVFQASGTRNVDGDEEPVSDNFRDALEEAESSGAEAIFAAYAGSAAGEVLKAYRQSGMKLPLYGPGTLTEGIELDELFAGNRQPQVATAMNYAPNLPNDQNRRFTALFSQIFNRQATAYSMAAYDAASLIDTSLRLMTGEPNAVDLNRAFSYLGRIESPRGPWAFTVNRTPQQHWYLRRVQRDGQVPSNIANEEVDVPA